MGDKELAHNAELVHRTAIRAAVSAYNGRMTASVGILIGKDAELMRYLEEAPQINTDDVRKHASQAWAQFLDRALQLRDDFNWSIREANQRLRAAQTARVIPQSKEVADAIG